MEPTGLHETVSGKLAAHVGMALLTEKLPSAILPHLQLRLGDVLPR